MKISIHQPQYLPWPGYINKIFLSDVFVFLDDVQYKKNEWQNRNRIKGPNGLIWLSVPVHYNFGQKNSDITIDNTASWQKKHKKSIEECYKKSEFFNDFFPYLKKIYEKEYKYLVDVNVDSITAILDYLKINKKIIFSSSLNITTQKTDRIIDICKTLKADTYISGQGAKDYLIVEKFKENNINLCFQKYKIKPYKQLWGDFIENLSIIDMIFNLGREETVKFISENSIL